MKKLFTLALTAAFVATAFPNSKQVPYSSTFYQDADWTVINTVEGTSTWEDNDWAKDFKGTGFSVGKEYGYDRKNAADDWLISPAIHLQAGKEYKISFWLDAGDMESLRLNWAQASTVEALSAEGSLLYEFEFIDWGWQRISKVVTPTVDGDYYFGFYVYSEKDKNNIELTGFEIRENVFAPAAPTNLSVTPDINGAVEAVISWALPTKDVDGADIPEGAVFNKVELYRDGILIETLGGDAVTFTDTETHGLTAGKHTYGVAVTINNVTSAKTELQSRYIGPLAAYTLPWTAGIGSLTSDDFETYYAIIKGEKSQTSSSRGWSLRSGYIQFYPNKWDRQDDWLMMPKVRFEKAGVYRLRTTAEFNETSDKPNVEIWKGTGKTISQMTEKLGAFTSLPQSKADVYVTFEIAEPGEYHLALHAAAEDPESAKYLKFYEFVVEESQARPVAVSDLAVVVEDNSARLTWTAPAVYNTGKPLESLTKIEIYRNDELLKTIDADLVPGAAMQYVDTPETGGLFTYKVIPYLNDLHPDSDPMTVSTTWIGDKLQQLPYNLNFADGVDSDVVKALWEIRNNDNDSYKWSVGSSAFTLSLDGDGGSADDMLLSPPFMLKSGVYDVVVRAKGGDSGLLTVGFIVEGTDTVANPQLIDLAGRNSYADYPAVITIDVPENNVEGAVRAASDKRGQLAVYAKGDYDWDLYNVMIQGVSVTPRNDDPDPSVGVDSIGISENAAERYFDLNGLEVRHPQKGSIYVVRTTEGKTRKVVF